MPFIPSDLPPAPIVQIIPGLPKNELSAPFSLIVNILPSPITSQSIRLSGRGEKSRSIIQILASSGNLHRIFKQKQTPSSIKPAPLASIITPHTADNERKEILYNQLVCTEVDKQNIGFIIRTMAENGKLSLLFKQGELKRIGAELNHVHPLKFLETIFANPALKEYMQSIHNDYFKWNGFLDGLVPSLNSQSDEGILMRYVEDFAKSVNVNPEEIVPYFQSREWEHLVRHLTNS